MSDVYADQYWANEFRVTDADVQRVAHWIGRTGAALEFDDILRRIITQEVKLIQQTIT